MFYFIQFLIVGLIFFITGYFSWWVTEKNKVPSFLDYQPFKCNKCLEFWLLVGLYITLGISFSLWVVLIAGIVLAILNAIAMWVNEKNKTISVDEYDSKFQ